VAAGGLIDFGRAQGENSLSSTRLADRIRSFLNSHKTQKRECLLSPLFLEGFVCLEILEIPGEAG
jgi:hypothetical protein